MGRFVNELEMCADGALVLADELDRCAAATREAPGACEIIGLPGDMSIHVGAVAGDSAVAERFTPSRATLLAETLRNTVKLSDARGRCYRVSLPGGMRLAVGIDWEEREEAF